MEQIGLVLGRLGLDPQRLRAARDNAAQFGGTRPASPGGLLHGLVPTPVRNHIGRMGMKEASAVERAQLDSRQGGAVAFGARAVGRGTPACNDNAGPKRTHAPVLRGAVPLVVVWG
jgi:hypothetical protein